MLHLVKMLAIRFGVSVSIDAAVVRILLIPSTLNYLGGESRWTPYRLDHGLNNA